MGDTSGLNEKFQARKQRTGIVARQLVRQYPTGQTGAAIMVLWGLTGGLALTLAAISLIDLRSFRIPDMLSLPLIAAGVGVVPATTGAGLHNLVIGATVGFAAFWAIGAWYHRRTGIDGLGLGDAKLFAAAGAWLGWQALPMVLLIAAAGGIVQALLRGKAARHTAIAFGPWLALGFWMIWIVRILEFG